jgi:hypothetical protein
VRIVTPAVRRWLLSKARDDLQDAEGEESICRKDESSLRPLAAENPQTWGEALERAERATADAQAQVRRMRAVVAELSEA